MTDDPPRSHDPVLEGLRIAAADAATQDWPTSALYVIATPIGNRADITVRALACLAKVDVVAAEDTRTARSLLRHYGIDKPMMAAHRHNEHEAAAALVTRLASGARVAYVSDAGTPGISDPGATLAAAARDAGHRVVPIPGASALTTALSAAGLGPAPSVFVGFLPARTVQAKTLMSSLSAVPAHLVFFEAPHRIVDTLTMIAATFPDRHCVIARELTKLFESIHRCRTEEATPWILADPQRQRGEFVIIVEGLADKAADDALRMSKALPILARLAAVLPLSEAASITAELTGLSRKALYAIALERK